MIARVEPASPAEHAGLRAGDVVVAANGHDVHGSGELRNRIGLVEADRSVRLDILRDGRRRTLEVAVTPMPEAPTESEVPALAGARLDANPSDHPAYGQLDGVFVAAVRRGSPAAATGLRRGDIILGVDGEPVTSPDELARAMAPAAGQVTLNLLRDGREIALVIG